MNNFEANEPILNSPTRNKHLWLGPFGAYNMGN